LPLTGVPENGLLYVGSSANLATREYHTHFKSGGSGFSTLRRSIGALLKSDLHLDTIPRGKGTSPSNYRNYRFDQSGEHALTNWMTHSLEACICLIDGHYREVEQKLIDNLHPILCLTGWSNPLAKEVKVLRKICANEAKARMNSSRWRNRGG